MEFPQLKCALSIEKKSGNSIHSSKETYSPANLTLARSDLKDIFLVIENGTVVKRYKLSNDDLVIHRKFVKEGKSSIHLKSLQITFMISNAPHHTLVQFLKCMASKLAGNHLKPGLSARQKLLSGSTNAINEISPITQVDVNNLKMVEAKKQGILKMTMSPVTTGRTKKRTRINVEDKENLIKSPLGKKHNNSIQRSNNKKSNLTEEQKYVLNAVKDGKNVFFTGGAGVGKSFLINKLIGALPPDCTVVTASTGVAAYPIGGVTLHSFAGIGSGSASLEQACEIVLKRSKVANSWRKCKHLIIDEISMVDGLFFDKLEAVARHVKGNDKPFGGIQLILSGDFLQLPPVVKHKNQRTFCFETAAWRKSVHLNIELTNVKRQSDPKFIRILSNLRKGICTDDTADILRATRLNEIEKNGLKATKLCTHSSDVAKINQNELMSLKDPIKTFRALDSDPALASFMNNYCPVEDKLELRVGAQVMLMKNCNLVQGLVNGARGCVVGFAKTTGNPLVRFANGHSEEIKSEKWMVKGTAGIILTRKQLPLKLAWAFSIHKSQGMTLDCVEMSLARVFESGQAYVALSRAKSLDSVKVTEFDPSCISADPKVLSFYSDMQAARPS